MTGVDKTHPTFLNLMDEWYDIKKKLTPFVTLLQRKKNEFALTDIDVFDISMVALNFLIMIWITSCIVIRHLKMIHLPTWYIPVKKRCKFRTRN